MYADKSAAKKRQALATSSGEPPRFSGMPARHWATTSSGSLSVISVSINPGAITFDLMFLEPNSSAIDFEKLITNETEWLSGITMTNP